MKYLLLLVLPLLLGNDPSKKPIVKENVKQITEEPLDEETCTCKGIPLYGKVQVVSNNANFKVHVTNTRWRKILEVQVVSSNALSCGEWEFVKSNPDFTIQYVGIGLEDFQVKFVNSNPGIVP